MYTKKLKGEKQGGIRILEPKQGKDNNIEGGVTYWPTVFGLSLVACVVIQQPPGSSCNLKGPN